MKTSFWVSDGKWHSWNSHQVGIPPHAPFPPWFPPHTHTFSLFCLTFPFFFFSFPPFPPFPPPFSLSPIFCPPLLFSPFFLSFSFIFFSFSQHTLQWQALWSAPLQIWNALPLICWRLNDKHSWETITQWQIPQKSERLSPLLTALFFSLSLPVCWVNELMAVQISTPCFLVPVIRSADAQGSTY